MTAAARAQAAHAVNAPQKALAGRMTSDQAPSVVAGTLLTAPGAVGTAARLENDHPERKRLTPAPGSISPPLPEAY